MERITQQTLDFDRKDAFEQNKDAKHLLEQEAKLLEKIDTFKCVIVSAQEELAIIRKKLKAVKKKFGVNKTDNTLIMEYVKQNPGKRHIDIARYIESVKGYYSNSIVTHAIQLGYIIENLDGTYSVGKKPLINLGVTDEVIKFAKNNEWFEIRLCFNFVNEKYPTISRNTIHNTLIRYIGTMFDIDRTGKYIKYRLKDEYRK